MSVSYQCHVSGTDGPGKEGCALHHGIHTGRSVVLPAGQPRPLQLTSPPAAVPIRIAVPPRMAMPGALPPPGVHEPTAAGVWSPPGVDGDLDAAGGAALLLTRCALAAAEADSGGSIVAPKTSQGLQLA
jgi:hypothetical protein